MSILPQLADSVKGCFVSLDDLPPGLPVMVCSRVSTEKQARQLEMQHRNLMRAAQGRQFQVVFDFKEIHTGATLDRPIFQDALEIARPRKLPMLWESIARIVRHPFYCPKKGRFPDPTAEQLKELSRLGVLFALLVPFDSSQGAIRSFESLRGTRGYSADQIRRVMVLREEGYSYGQIAIFSGIPKQTVIRLAQNRTKV